MEDGDLNLPPNGRQQPNERIARSKTFGCQQGLNRRNSSGQGREEGLTRSKTFGRQEGSSSVPSLIITIHSDATNGTSQGEDPSPSASNGIVASSSKIYRATSSLNSGTSHGEHPTPSPTNGIASSSEICQAPSRSQGEDPSPSPTNGNLFLQNQKRMEEGGINMADIARQRVRIARSETFPRTCHHSIMMANPDATSSLNPGTSEGEGPSPSPTNGNLFLQNQKRKMEEGGINMAHNGRQKAKVRIARSQTLPRTSHHSIMMGKATSSLNSRTSQGKNLSPSPTHGIRVVSSNSGSSQGVDPSPSPTNGSKRTLDEYRCQCVPLLKAATKGDWSAAKAFLVENPDYVRAPITNGEETALHIAVAAQHTTFINKLLKLMVSKDLELKAQYGFTALHCAAQVGNVRIAKQLVKMNCFPLLITDVNGDTPLDVAAFIGHKNMVSYLFYRTPLQYLTDAKRIELLHESIYNDLYDIALEILKKYPNIATVNTKCWWKALEILAKKPIAIGSESRLSFWKSLLKDFGICDKALANILAHQLVEELWKTVGITNNPSPNVVSYQNPIIFEAAKAGNVEFLSMFARSYPEHILNLDENQMSIFHIAISYRHESLFNLIYEIHAGKDSLEAYHNSETDENTLHLAGKLAPLDRLNIVSGAALQMQLELLWFKKIEKIVPRSYMNMKNAKGQTPKEVFVDEHTNLQQNGEKWMKETSNYCIVVATLIATVVFAAALTVPGGNNEKIGTPILLRSNWFMVFLISDAIAMCFSSTSIIIFLSMFSSRYREVDFLMSLPLKLVFGLATLFISIVGMMVAFSATCFMMYGSTRRLLPVVVLSSSAIPITLFFLLHHKIWVDTYRSTTYGSRFLFGSHKRRLFLGKMPIGELSRKFKSNKKEGKLSEVQGKLTS